MLQVLFIESAPSLAFKLTASRQLLSYLWSVLAISLLAILFSNFIWPVKVFGIVLLFAMALWSGNQLKQTDIVSLNYHPAKGWFIAYSSRFNKAIDNPVSAQLSKHFKIPGLVILTFKINALVRPNTTTKFWPCCNRNQYQHVIITRDNLTDQSTTVDQLFIALRLYPSLQ